MLLKAKSNSPLYQACKLLFLLGFVWCFFYCNREVNPTENVALIKTPQDSVTKTKPLEILPGYELYAWKESDKISFAIDWGVHKIRTLSEIKNLQETWHQDTLWSIRGEGLEAFKKALPKLWPEVDLFFASLRNLKQLDDLNYMRAQFVLFANGYYCVNQSTVFPSSVKGYELYAWDDSTGFNFTLITGTNRLKQLKEIMIQDTVVADSDFVLVHGHDMENLERTLGRINYSQMVFLQNLTGLPALSDSLKIQVQASLHAFEY